MVAVVDSKRHKPMRRPTPTKASGPPADDKLLTMQQAMQYLVEKGVSCKCRSTFYRILKDFGVQYVNFNPNGKYEVRRFRLEDLQKVVLAKGLKL